MRLLHLLPLAALTACAPGDARVATHQPQIDTLPTGVIAVTNIGPSAWADTNGWKLVLEQTIAPAEGSPGEIGAPRGIVADSRGRVFLVDRQPVAIRAYAPTGEFLFAFSREGGGPGEISGNGLLMIANDTLIFHDQAQARTQLWTTDGEFVRGWSSHCCVSMPVAVDRQGRIPIPAAVYEPIEGAAMFSNIGYVRYRLDGSVVDTVRAAVGLAREEKLWRFTTPGGSSINTVPMQPSETRRLSPDGLPVWGHQSAYRFVILSEDLDTLRTFTAPAATVPIPDSVRQRVIDETLEQTPELSGVAKIEDLPTTYAPWETLTFDGHGNIWVLAAGPSGGTDHFDVFTAEGVLLGSVPSPLRTLYRTYWTADRVYAVVEDEATGLPRIQVYRIDRGDR